MVCQGSFGGSPHLIRGPSGPLRQSSSGSSSSLGIRSHHKIDLKTIARHVGQGMLRRPRHMRHVVALVVSIMVSVKNPVPLQTGHKISPFPSHCLHPGLPALEKSSRRSGNPRSDGDESSEFLASEFAFSARASSSFLSFFSSFSSPLSVWLVHEMRRRRNITGACNGGFVILLHATVELRQVENSACRLTRFCRECKHWHSEINNGETKALKVFGFLAESIFHSRQTKI